MAIIRANDPVTDAEIVMVTGKVDRIIIKEAEKTPKNIEFGVTHIASLQVDGQYINFISLSTKEGREPNIAINVGTKAAPKWERVEEGDEVKVIVSETVKGDKTYYNAKRTGIKITKKGAGGSSGGSSQGGTGTSFQSKPKFDQTGVSTGQSVNGALNFLITYGVEASNENIIKYGKMVHTVTEKVKEYVKTVNPEASEYEQGARGGLAVLTACKLVGADQDFEQGVEAIAKDLVDNVFPPIMDFVKNGEKQPAPPAKVTRAPVKKPAATKAKPVEESQPSASRTGFDDMDDDIPFANPMRLSAGLYLAI